MPCNDTRSHEDERECDFGKIFPSFVHLTGFLVCFCGLFVFSVVINCYLLYLTLRRRNTKQPQYIILANLAVCDILIAITPCIHVLPSVLQEETVILSKGCIGFVPIFGNFMVACMLIWTLLSAERYIFICRGIDYLRIVTTHRIRWTLGVIWAIVLFLNIYHQVLIYYKLHFVEKPLDTLMCDALTMEKLTELTSTDMWLLRGPPGCVALFSVIAIFTCNLLIFRAAYKAALALCQSNRKAACNVGCYLGMFLVQLLPIAFSFTRSKIHQTYPELTSQSQLLLLILTMVTPSANAATVIYRNTQFKEELRSLCTHTVRGPEDIEMQVRRCVRVMESSNSHAQ